MPRILPALLLFSASLLQIPPCIAQDVPWLAEVTTPPANPVLPASGRLDPLLPAPTATLADWQQQRQRLLAQWQEFLGPAIRDENFPLNHHQLLGLIAPRPFLVIGGESGPGAADGDRSWVLLNAALPVWKLYGTPQRLAVLNHRQGHSIPDSAFERMAEWLQRYTEKTAEQ